MKTKIILLSLISHTLLHNQVSRKHISIKVLDEINVLTTQTTDITINFKATRSLMGCMSVTAGLICIIKSINRRVPTTLLYSTSSSNRNIQLRKHHITFREIPYVEYKLHCRNKTLLYTSPYTDHLLIIINSMKISPPQTRGFGTRVILVT